MNRILIIAGIALAFGVSAVTWGQDEDDLGAEIEAAESMESSPEEITLEPLEGNEELKLEPEPEVKPKPEEPVAQPEPEVAPEEYPEPESIAEPEQTPEQSPDQEPEGLEAYPEPEMAIQSDAPNLEYEARLYDIYINYNSKKLGDEEWAALIGDRESEVYRIQPGDTLWGISKLFFNDGNYWPKIWSLNTRITNPHLIQPGNEIRFLLGTESDAPSFTVTEAGTPEPQIELPAVTEVGGATVNAVSGVNTSPTDDVDIPPPSEIYPPVLKKVPPSLPEWTLQTKTEQYDDTGIAFGRRPILDLKDAKYLSAFMDEKDIEFAGEVTEIEGGARTAANFQYVFVALEPGAAKTGDIYTVIKPRGKLLRSNGHISNGDLGYMYQVLGEVKIDSLLTTTSGSKPRDIFRAVVENAIHQVEQGAMVRAGKMPVIGIEEDENQRMDIVLQIVGGDLMERQKTLGLHSLAFLNGGADKGLSEGQILTVRANTRIRNPKSQIKESYIPVGQIRIAHVSQRYATGIVTKVWDSIYVGDVTGEGKVLPPDPNLRPGPSRASAPAPAPEGNDEDAIEEELEEDLGEDFGEDLEGELQE